MPIVPDLEELDKLFANVGGFDDAYKKLLRLAQKQLQGARIACPNATYFAELDPEELVQDALIRLIEEVPEGENGYFAARNFVRNGIRTHKKSPETLSSQFPPTGGTDEEWNDFFDSQAGEDSTPSEIAVMSEQEEALKTFLEELKSQFADDEDVGELLLALECEIYTRKEILAETDLNGPRYDAACKRLQRAAAKKKGIVTNA